MAFKSWIDISWTQDARSFKGACLTALWKGHFGFLPDFFWISSFIEITLYDTICKKFYSQFFNRIVKMCVKETSQANFALLYAFLS